jgi:5-formyltetrahydrofolate cyclo-ligase
MVFYQIKNLASLTKSKKFRFFEPIAKPSSLLKDVNLIDVVFLPLTVFDQNLQRIGTGYGYYDR